MSKVCFQCIAQGVTFELDDDTVADEDDRDGLQEIINNSKLSEGYLQRIFIRFEVIITFWHKKYL